MGTRILLTGRGGIVGDGVDPAARAFAGAGRLGGRAIAYLLLERRRSVPRSELAAALWGDDLPETWEASLRKVTARVRQVIDEAGMPAATLSVDDGVFRLELAPGVTVDVEEAAAALAAAEAALAGGDTESALRLAGEATGLVADDLLPGDDAPWLERRRAEVRELHVRALEVTCDAHARTPDWRAAAAAAREAVAAAPDREAAAVRLMRALAESGDRASALRVHEDLRRHLRDNLGVSPSRATEDAYLDLLRDSPPAPAPRRPSAPLPAELTGLVGRVDEVEEIRELLGSSRLVTLTGTGGIGKTRIAVATARRLASELPVIAFVTLAHVADADHVPGAVLQALGAADAERRSGAPVDEVLAERRGLLLVDNCEHVVEAAALLVASILRACPRVAILATSREPLRVQGETVRRVRPLTTPPGGTADPAAVMASEAGRLFVERAAAARADYSLGAGDAGHVARICAGLDGIPLAVELAAARMGALSAGEIADRLDARFHLLAAGPRTSPERHRSLEAAIAWSYDTLEHAERLVFERLSVFGGHVALSAAEAVCAGPGVATTDVAALLSALHDRSLLVRDPDGGRCRLLGPIRGFAGDRLAASGDAARVQQGLVAWATELAEATDRALDGPEQEPALLRAEADHDNLRAALRWATANADPGAVRLAGALGRFWDARGHLEEGRMWLRTALATPDDAPTWAWARALMSAAVLAQLQGDRAAAAPMFEAALAMWRRLDDALGAAAALNGLAGLADGGGDAGRARELYEECLELGRRAGDDRVRAAAVANLGRLAHRRA
ncbi:MAG TPA: BTAD domain-containing putative transcriptional regulator, partial [Candidatus Dormibacteraeota bacterium]|nr:BTAD domain-containing putative transcriptional regulator [Candidatus Dormibacteraeota bacterium]